MYLVKKFKVREEDYIIIAVFLVNLLGIVFAVAVFYEFFETQLARLNYWQITHLFFNDISALILFAIYFINYFVFNNRDVSDGVNQRAQIIWWLSITVLTLGFFVDAYSSWSIKQSLRESFDKSILGNGIIRKYTVYTNQANEFRIDFEYTDLAQQLHNTYVIVKKSQEQLLPQQLLKEIKQEKFPLPVSVRFNPDFPTRVWITDLGFQGASEGVIAFSIITMTFQVSVMLVFLAKEYQLSQKGIVPWWHELHGTILLSVETGFLSLCGIRHVIDSRPAIFELIQ